MRSRIILQYKTDKPILVQEVYKGKKTTKFHTFDQPICTKLSNATNE